MKYKIKRLLSTYKAKIKLVEVANLSELQNVINGIHISRSYLQTLRKLVRDKVFDKIDDEIYFFKNQKPYVYGRLKFFVNLHKYISEKPEASIKKQRKFILENLNKIDQRKKANLDFEKYYLQNQTQLDKYFFVRGKDTLELISDTSHYYTDPEFSTSHDNMVARIIASELLINHYNAELDVLRRKELYVNEEETNQYPLQSFSWSGSKTDLVELIYALQASKTIRNGKVDIKQMAQVSEKLFNINLGNFYRTYLEIRERKKERTQFLNHLKISLESKMNEDDNKY